MQIAEIVTDDRDAGLESSGNEKLGNRGGLTNSEFGMNSHEFLLVFFVFA